MSDRTNPTLLLADIIESSEKILHYTKAMSVEDFISNEVIPK
jgi:uncharacterized protein with HEPN domain